MYRLDKKLTLFTAQCYSECSTAMAYRLSVHDIEVPWSHWLETFKNKFHG